VKILYHIAKRPARPTSWEGHGLKGEVVFLGTRWQDIALWHGIKGNVYIYKVPCAIVKKYGLRRFDRVTEIVIPKKDWNNKWFLGKYMEKQELALWHRREENKMISGTHPHSLRSREVWELMSARNEPLGKKYISISDNPNSDRIRE